ncbi:PREDICTED: cathepsin G-like [Tauraco erythrolophus]|uniref:cathepsin G-like n=1 Tax=Tauraco erythrolophus TaxID=121530 RepID=UPI000523CBEE|nr:PREDICTED: cathepsin G-like [Tauraco erythrolophus]
MLILLLLTSPFLLLPWAEAGEIIGGSEAKPHSRPYMAYLTIANESHTSHCGGFLLRPDAVLSAAHCVAGKRHSKALYELSKPLNAKITVILGAHNIHKNEPSQQEFHVGHWVIHPKYSMDTFKNDIMLLKLKPRAKRTKEVSQIPLASHNEHVQPGAICKVAGWGRTSKTRAKTSVLMEVDLKVQSDKVCEKHSKNYLCQSMICVGDEDGKKSTFKGDSGGPLVCNGKAHGVVSYVSYGRKYYLFPNVFTRVSWFIPWIQEELRKFALQDLPDSLSSD